MDARSNSRFNPVTGLTNIVSRIVRTRCSNSIVVANTFSSRRSSHKTINGTICSENTKVGLHFVYKTSNATTCWNSINDDRSRKIFTNKAGVVCFRKLRCSGKCVYNVSTRFESNSILGVRCARV